MTITNGHNRFPLPQTRLTGDIRLGEEVPVADFPSVLNALQDLMEEFHIDKIDVAWARSKFDRE